MKVTSKLSEVASIVAAGLVAVAAELVPVAIAELVAEPAIRPVSAST
jgi:hypothetical protein